MDLKLLPPLVRVLLATDGTVTRSLSAYYLEPVKVEVLHQDSELIEQDDAILACAAGEKIWHRQVRLVGQDSAAIYAYADTRLNDAALPEQLRSALQRQAIGVGELLQVKSLETYRDITQNGLLSVLPEPFRDDYGNDSEVAWRHYSISHRLQRLMHIQEYFPLRSFSA